MVGIKFDGAAFLTSFQEGPHQKLFFQGFFQILQVRWQTVFRYCQLSYIFTGKLLATHF